MNKTTGYTPSTPDLDLIDKFIVAALAEDAGSGDHSSLASVPANARNKAVLKVKDVGVLAGVDLAVIILQKVDPEAQVRVFLQDGTLVQKGDIAFEVEANSRAILLAERLLLNCMQRMSGIATSTHLLVQLIRGTKAKVIDTRKTTPGFRYFEKWAVVIGGGSNHRFGLYDMIMLKDNHVDYAGGITNAINSTEEYLKKNKLNLKVEIEVRNMSELDEVLSIGKVNRIMLDNFSVKDMAEGVKRINGRFETEASGGINAENIRDYALTGVDFISVGSLTHHVKSLDLSLKAV